jgi:DNA-binding MarR family transcriptional regulator
MEPITQAILALVNHIQLHQRDEIEQCRKQSKDIVPLHTVAEFFVLKKIGQTGTINASSLSETLRISKSGISKITGRFLERELIIAERRNGNEKEIYYSLTDYGKQVYDIQKQIGREKNIQLKAFLADFNEEEQETILKFLTGIKEVLYGSAPSKNQ